MLFELVVSDFSQLATICSELRPAKSVNYTEIGLIVALALLSLFSVYSHMVKKNVGCN